MKRLTYISKAATDLTAQDIDTIGEISSQNNSKCGVTGILIFLNGVFYQVLEGEAATVDALYEKISADTRHHAVLCLKAENKIQNRLFPEWHMKTINLEQDANLLLTPIKALLQTVSESHDILRHYTQPSVVNLINQGVNPLQIEPRIVGKIICFSDIVSFATFAEKLPVHEVVNLVNQYLIICTRCITAQGGEVMKFIGDSVMAAFAESAADAALQAGLNILQELSELRAAASLDSPLHLLYAGIGLAHGQVIEGNIGSPIKMDYTMIGDAVNTAARIEALTRHLPYALVFSESVKQHCQLDWAFTEIGKYEIKGKVEQLDLFAINHIVAHKSSNAAQTAHFIRQSLDELDIAPT